MQGGAGWQSAALVSRNVKWKDVCGGCVHPAMAELSCVVSKVCMWLQLTAEERPTVPKVSAPPSPLIKIMFPLSQVRNACLKNLLHLKQSQLKGVSL